MVAVDRLTGLSQMAAIKAPCRVVATSNITLSGLQSIDSVTVAADDRVLVTAQTDGTDNGIYTVDSGAWTRAPDFDGTGDVLKGTIVVIASGTVYSGTVWQLTTTDPDIDTDSLSFSIMGTGALSGVSTFIQTVLDDLTEAAARTTLGAAASGANTDITSVYLNNTGLKVKDTNASHGLSIVPGSNITADRTLTVTTGDADRTLTLTGNASIPATTAAQATNDTGFGTNAYVDRVAVQQIVSSVSGAVATGTTAMPWDDTIPLNTEGDQYMSLAITPKSATSTLLIQVVGVFASSVSDVMVMALFRDSTANALAAVPSHDIAANVNNLIPLNYKMTSGTTSATTFKIRAGTNGAGTTTFNGSGAGRKLGGVAASSIIIMEIGI